MAEYNNNNRGGGAGGNDRGGNNRGGNDRRGNDRGGRGNDNAVQGESDLKEKVVAINRVAKVVKGGRRFSFSAIVVVGDGKGTVGYGLGKANEVTDAIAKGIDDARKNLVKVPIYKQHTVPHLMEGKYSGGYVLVQPAAAGTGVIAGGAMRAVFESAGIKDVLAKSKGSSNPHNVVKATFDALAKMRDPMQIAQARGISLARVFNG